MPNVPERADDNSSASELSEALQPAIDAASGDPRSGEEPGEQQRARQGEPEGASATAAEAHSPPADQPSQDNTDRRA